MDLNRHLQDTAGRWYTAAMQHTRQNGLLASAVAYLGSLGGQVAWKPERLDNGEWVPDEQIAGQQVAQSLGHLDTGRVVSLLESPGVCYLTVAPHEHTLIDWQVWSASELLLPWGGGMAPLTARSSNAIPRPLWQPDTPMAERPAVLRVWRPDLEWSQDPWSPVLACLPHLEALHLMVLAAAADDQSRLTGAGILYLPNSVAFPDIMSADDGLNVAQSPVFRRLVRSITESTIDADSVDRVVPIVITGPDDAGDKIKHLMLERRSDASSWENRWDKHQREIAQALDMPASVVLNTQDGAKYANARAIDVDLLRTYLPRFTGLIAKAVTEEIYRPLLERWNVEAPWDRRIVADTKHLDPAEDQTDRAIQLLDKGLITREGAQDMAAIPDDRRLKPDTKEFRLWASTMKVDITDNTAPAVLPPPSMFDITRRAALPGRLAAFHNTPVEIEQPAPPTGRDWAGIAAQLNRVEADTRARLTGALDAALAGAIETAGRRTTPRIKQAALRTELASLPAHARTRALGAGRAAAFGITEDELLRDSLAGLAVIIGPILTDAHHATAALLGDLAPATDLVTGWVGAAVSNAEHGLRDAARHHLWTETDTMLRAPTITVRQILADAGGNPTRDGMPPLGGLTSGDGTLAAVKALPDAPVKRWRWTHRATTHPFPAHLDLDGVEFDDYSDPKVANADPATRFTGFGAFSPSDHNGCGCSVDLILGSVR